MTYEGSTCTLYSVEPQAGPREDHLPLLSGTHIVLPIIIPRLLQNFSSRLRYHIQAPENRLRLRDFSRLLHNSLWHQARPATSDKCQSLHSKHSKIFCNWYTSDKCQFATHRLPRDGQPPINGAAKMNHRRCTTLYTIRAETEGDVISYVLVCAVCTRGLVRQDYTFGSWCVFGNVLICDPPLRATKTILLSFQALLSEEDQGIIIV